MRGRRERQHNVRSSKRAEERLAQRVGGRRQPASGALWGAPGDVVSELELIEQKITGKSQITIKAAWLQKIWNLAVSRGKRPVLQIELDGISYYVLTEEDYADLMMEAGSGMAMAEVDGRGTVLGDRSEGRDPASHRDPRRRRPT